MLTLHLLLPRLFAYDFALGRSGNEYRGQWVEDVRHGMGTMTWKDRRETYTGMWSAGLQVRAETVVSSETIRMYVSRIRGVM